MDCCNKSPVFLLEQSSRSLAREEAAFSRAGGFLVRGLVVGIEVAPVTCRMAIEQGGDERVGNVGGHGGGGHHSAEVMEHGAGG